MQGEAKLLYSCSRGLADPTARSAAVMAFFGCPAWCKESQAFVPLHRPVTGCGLPLERGHLVSLTKGNF